MNGFIWNKTRQISEEPANRDNDNKVTAENRKAHVAILTAFFAWISGQQVTVMFWWLQSGHSKVEAAKHFW